MVPVAPKSLTSLINKSSGSVTEAFEARCKLSPDHAFVVEGNKVITYNDAWKKASQAAGFFVERGLAGQDQSVTTFLSHRSEALWGWFGTQLLGTVHSFLNWEHRGELLMDMLRLTKSRIIITEAAGWDLLSGLDDSRIEMVLFVDHVPEAAKNSGFQIFTLKDVFSSKPVKPKSVRASGISALIFSSGSTGRSKAVQIPHNMIVRGAARIVDAIEMTESDIIHFTNPLHHIVGQLHLVMVAIISGATLAIFPRFSRSQFWDQVRERQVTYLCCFSNVMRYLLSDPENDKDANTTLRYVTVAQGSPDELAVFSKRFNVTTIDSYGMTEGEPLTLPAPSIMPVGSCGRVNPDFDVAIMDMDGNLLPRGMRGNIVFRPNVPDIMMYGYVDDAQSTIQAWNNLWFHTQDIGYLDQNNFLYYVERLKFTIRRKGENIVPAELESVVRKHSSVEDCVAVGIPAEQGEEDIKLFVCPVSNQWIDAEMIKTYCEENLARFMVPQVIEIVGSLPYTQAGKIDRRKLC